MDKLQLNVLQLENVDRNSHDVCGKINFLCSIVVNLFEGNKLLFAFKFFNAFIRSFEYFNLTPNQEIPSKIIK